MVRQCLAEDSLSTYIDSLLQLRVDAEVGLIIGHSGGAKDYLFFVVKTPYQDGAVPVRVEGAAPVAGKKPQKGRSAADDVVVTLDVDWLTEHATQVARLLLGGVSVLGYYLLASDAGFQSAAPQLCRLAGALSGSPSQAPMLLHISAATGKASAKECLPGGSTAAALRPVDLKMGPALASFQAVACRYRLDAFIPLPKRNTLLAAECEQLMEAELRRLGAAVVAVGELPLSASQTVAEALPAAHPLQQLTLYCPPAGPPATGSSAVGCLRLQGTLNGRAYVLKRDAAPSAGAALKADLAASLRGRMEAVREEAEALAGAEELHPLLGPPPVDAVVSPSMPFRLFMPTRAGVTVCEYLAEGESREDAVARAHELLGGQVLSDTVIVDGEGAKRPSPPAVPWDALAVPKEENAVMRRTPAPQKPKSCLWVITVWMSAAGIVAALGVLGSNQMMAYFESSGMLN